MTEFRNIERVAAPIFAFAVAFDGREGLGFDGAGNSMLIGRVINQSEREVAK